MKKIVFFILLIVFNIIFWVIAFDIQGKIYNHVYHIMPIFQLSEISILVALFSLDSKSKRKFLQKKWVSRTFIIISSILSVSAFIIFFAFLPQYTMKEAYSIVKEDPRFITEDIKESEVGCLLGDSGNMLLKFGYTFNYYDADYIPYMILFDPGTGKYNVFKDQ